MKRRILKWLMLLALVLVIISIVIFLFGEPSFSENQVVLELEGPTQTVAGVEVAYKVKYGNETKTNLSNLKFKFIYPDESVVIRDGEILKELSETFTLDELKSGSSGEKEFYAFLVGD